MHAYMHLIWVLFVRYSKRLCKNSIWEIAGSYSSFSMIWIFLLIVSCQICFFSMFETFSMGIRATALKATIQMIFEMWLNTIGMASQSSRIDWNRKVRVTNLDFNKLIVLGGEWRTKITMFGFVWINSRMHSTHPYQAMNLWVQRVHAANWKRSVLRDFLKFNIHHLKGNSWK